MNSNTSYKEYTFLELLNQYDMILVPMIQRDYAQGRTNKKATDVRNNLLNDIFSDKKVHFDLVFGSVESKIVDGECKRCFIPVDGQQRLTTLFLLYLYGQRQLSLYQELDLSKFTYDTRRAAADFCKSVTRKEWFYDNEGKVSDAIKDCSWFMDYWAQDPTVDGMLNMLDAIHEKYNQENKFPDFGKVTFYFFDLESNGLNENLYLKMNSRGKPLTAFENLKAKIEKVLPDNIKTEEKCFPECGAAPKDSFKEKWKYFMDRNWTEAFWDSANPCKYDVNVAKFIVRFLSGYWAAFGQEIAGKTTAKSLKDINRSELNDSNYSDYIQFESIEQVLKLDNAFPSLAYAMTIVPNIVPYWTNDTIKVSDKSEFKFLAVVFTFVLFDGDKTAMRFAWNMTGNHVTEYDTFVTYCKRAGEIYTFRRNKNFTFYQTLSKIKFVGNISDQLKEEIAKAKQILDENGLIHKYEGSCKKEDGSNYQTWEEIIIEAEKYAFFKGSIRFLFQNEKGLVDWNLFDLKREYSNKYFQKVTRPKASAMQEQYRNADLLKLMISWFSADSFWNVLWWRHRTFNNKPETWLYYLLNNNICYAIHHMMIGRKNDSKSFKCSSDFAERTIYILANTPLLDFVRTKIPNSWIRNYHYHIAIFPSGTGVFLNAEKRDSLLSSTEQIKIRDEHIIKGSTLLFGSDINFTFNNYNFQWYRKDILYMMKKNQYKTYMIKDDKAKVDADKYFCFNAREINENRDLINRLNELIDTVSKSVSE